MPKVTVKDVADHVEHLVRLAGIDHVGIGGDLDGIETTPDGLEGVEAYPNLIAELLRRGMSEKDAAKLTGGNILRVLAAAENVAAGLAGETPSDARP